MIRIRSSFVSLLKMIPQISSGSSGTSAICGDQCFPLIGTCLSRQELIEQTLTPTQFEIVGELACKIDLSRVLPSAKQQTTYVGKHSWPLERKDKNKGRKEEDGTWVLFLSRFAFIGAILQCLTF